MEELVKWLEGLEQKFTHNPTSTWQLENRYKWGVLQPLACFMGAHLCQW